MEIKEYIKNFFTLTGFGMVGLVLSIQIFSPLGREINRNFNKIQIKFKAPQGDKVMEFTVSRGGQHRKQLQNHILRENEGVIYLIFPPKKVLIDSALMSEAIDFLAVNRQGKILEKRTVVDCKNGKLCTKERMKEEAYYVVAVKAGTAEKMGFIPGRILPLPDVLPMPDYEKEVEKAFSRLQQILEE